MTVAISTSAGAVTSVSAICSRPEISPVFVLSSCRLSSAATARYRYFPFLFFFFIVVVFRAVKVAATVATHERGREETGRNFQSNILPGDEVAERAPRSGKKIVYSKTVAHRISSS